MSDAGEDRPLKMEGDEETVVRVRGLPWSASVDDVLKFFDGVNIKNAASGVHLTLSREGRPSGEAYIEMETEADVALAEKKHNQHMGRRYIEVFKAKKSEMEWVVKRAGFGVSGGEDDGCVRLRGLPFGCSKEEIAQFFSGLEIVPNGIALPTDYQGRHTGEAFVQFINKDVAEKSLEKHKEKIAHRYIEIFRSNLGEVRAAMSPKMRGPGGPMGGYNNRPTPYDSRDRFGGMNRYSLGGRGRTHFASEGGYNDYDDGPGWGGSGGYNDGPGWLSGRGGRGGGPGLKGNFGGRGSNWNNGTGHCVHMRGLPFRATEMDIADFFRPLNPVNINIIMDSSNRPSGEADIEFATHDDAVKAMSKDKANMQHRYIELFLNSTPGGNMGGPGGPMGGPVGPMGGPGSGNFGSGGGNFSSNNMGGGFGGGYGGGNRMGGGGSGYNNSGMGGGGGNSGGYSSLDDGLGSGMGSGMGGGSGGMSGGMGSSGLSSGMGGGGGGGMGGSGLGSGSLSSSLSGSLRGMGSGLSSGIGSGMSGSGSGLGNSGMGSGSGNFSTSSFNNGYNSNNGYPDQMMGTNYNTF